MKNLLEIFSNDWTNVIGWTLLHSLWQSLAILLITLACLRSIPAMRSGLRYLVACSGFLLMITVSIVTLCYLQHRVDRLEKDTTVSFASIRSGGYENDLSVLKANGLFSTLVPVIEAAIPYVVAIWAVGFLFYGARLSAGLLQTYKLRSTARPLENEWMIFLSEAGRRLGIERPVTLAESHNITTPVVLGWLKPVVLIPVGMLSGLSTEQLETIFLHELAHIRRNDYLVNFVQSVFETILFFNPFVRILSNEIRKEREFCCDDLVVAHHGGSRAYAYALAQLAEAKLSASGFALALADDNNHLLQRIKRIVGKSVKHPGKSRLVIPAVVLLGALLCISWLGSGRTDVRDNPGQSPANDTLPNNESVARYSRKSIITFDENGQPHEEIVEEFEGDERLRPLIQPHNPVVPHLNVIPPAFPAPDASQVLPDTIPPAGGPFGLKGHENWEEWSRLFEERLHSRFEELYGIMESDSSRWMELDQFPFPDWDEFDLPSGAFKGLEEFERADGFQGLNEQLEKLRKLELERFHQFEKEFDFHGGRMGRYEKVLRDELVKDGYLKDGEAIESLEWDDESFKVNGKTINDKHRKKYNDLNDEFFGETGERRRVE